MRTVSDRAEKLLEDLIYCDFRTEVGTDKARRLIRRALLAQDGETRQACAAAVGAIEAEVDRRGRDTILQSVAEDACINAYNSDIVTDLTTEDKRI